MGIIGRAALHLPWARCAAHIRMGRLPSCAGAARHRVGYCCVPAHLTAGSRESFRR